MTVPYEATGRRNQKLRTRDALIASARALLARGVSPRVADAAADAGISRTTAYRYFPTQRALLLAAHPEIEATSLLTGSAPDDPCQRLESVMREFTRLTIDWEPQLRTQLRLSLEPGAEQPVLRQGRAIGWIEDALSPLRQTHPHLDVHRLAVTIRSATGIESFVWLTDIAGIAHPEAANILCNTAQAILHDALSADRARPE